MLREIVIPKEEEYVIKIPREYVNKRVEILVLPLGEGSKLKSKKEENVFLKTSGILKNYGIDPLLWQKEIREEWDK